MKRLMAYILPAFLIAGVPIQSRAQQALTVSPASATVQAGQPITFTASGGAPFYYWDAGGNSGAVPQTGFGTAFTVTYPRAGFFSLGLTDSTGAMVTVSVQVTSNAICQPAAVPSSFRFYTAYINDSGFGTPNFPDAIAQTAGDTNTVWVGSQTGTPDQIADADVTAICEASRTGRPVVLEFDDLCFSNGLLRSDWQARLARWTDRLTPYQANIAGLYPIDEPYEQAALVFHIPVATMYQQLVAVTARLKASFPSIPTMVIVQGFTIETLQPIPSTYDFVGSISMRRSMALRMAGTGSPITRHGSRECCNPASGLSWCHGHGRCHPR